MWVLQDRGVGMALHYLDDLALATTLALCEELGFPVAEDKTEGPSTTLTFLGIEIDTLQL